MAKMFANTALPTCAASSPLCCRNRCCSQPASPRTSLTVTRTQPTKKSSPPPRPPVRTTSSCACPRDMTLAPGSAELCFRAESANASLWRAPSAGSHDFIMRMPEGYDTRPGERGTLLSGGERQRISLARAFLRNSPILILDEPTSSVDVQTEASIMQATEALMRGRTTFMIAHRLNTLKSCDLILVLDRGALAEVRETLPERLSLFAD